MMPQLLNAQKKVPIKMPNYDNETFHYGFVIGYNQMFYSIDYSEGFHNMTPYDPSDIQFNNTSADLVKEFNIRDITPSMQHGFTVGIIGNLRLARHFDLRLIPSLSFGDKRVVYVADLYDEKGNYLFSRTKTSQTDHVYVELPLQIKCKSKRVNNYAAYIIAGTNFKLDMYPHKKDKDSGSENTDNIGNNTDMHINKNGITSDRFDVAAEIGAGFDFYTGFFKLGVELKMSYGLLNVKKDVPSFYNDGFENLRNKTFQLSFTFE